MTKEEFEKRTGLKVKAEVFDKVQDIYMACGEGMNKDGFCALWKENNFRALLDAVTGEWKISEGAYNLAMKKIKEMEAERESDNWELAELLLGKAAAHQDSDLRREAVKLIGERNAVLTMLRLNLPLQEEDMEYIKNHLK